LRVESGQYPSETPRVGIRSQLFQVPCELRDVKQILNWLYEILHKKALPFDLGSIDLNGDDLFELVITPTTYTQSYANDYFRVHFNTPLALLLEELCDSNTPTEAGGQLFYPMIAKEGKWVQTINTLERCNKIESIVLFTTLPVTKMGLADPTSGTVRKEAVLGTIEFNSGQYNLRAKTDWRYIPNVFRHTTLDSVAGIQSYDIWVMLRYTNGDMRAHVLAPSERANINIAFYPRNTSF
jgi:hypothetical protein